MHSHLPIEAVTKPSFETGAVIETHIHHPTVRLPKHVPQLDPNTRPAAMEALNEYPIITHIVRHLVTSAAPIVDPIGNRRTCNGIKHPHAELRRDWLGPEKSIPLSRSGRLVHGLTQHHLAEAEQAISELFPDFQRNDACNKVSVSAMRVCRLWNRIGKEHIVASNTFMFTNHEAYHCFKMGNWRVARLMQNVILLCPIKQTSTFTQRVANMFMLERERIVDFHLTTREFSPIGFLNSWNNGFPSIMSNLKHLTLHLMNWEQKEVLQYVVDPILGYAPVEEVVSKPKRFVRGFDLKEGVAGLAMFGWRGEEIRMKGCDAEGEQQLIRLCEDALKKDNGRGEAGRPHALVRQRP